ncbi:MAG TPA: hypothetical protein VHL14_10040, partial [Steroidobacteraceae bacterium]|nr:hypothetical protein [Steroidobacteraceae bacterium]
MKMTNWRSVIAAATAALALHCNAEPLIDYFNTCERELQFTDSEYDTAIGPVKSCYDVDQFAAPINSSDPTNDYIGYAQINDKVDLVFACRWVKGTKENQLREQSYETIIHNRQSGKTCFFDAAITDPLVVPLTVRDQGPFPNAKSWWKSPDTIVADKKVCTDCHSSGPYIASPRIVNYLQKYGLINNGHDTTQNDGRLISHIRYQAVGVTFSDYTPIARFNVGLNYFPRISSDVPFNTSTCADACHALNVNNPPDITATFSGTTKVVIPSIHSVQTEIASNASLMPPTQLASSPYRWVNMDTPATDGGEYETLANLRQQYPKFACAPTTPSAPAVVALRAHVVGNSNSFTTVSAALLPDKLRTFNARDGL